MKCLFFHGYQSSKQSTKYTAITYDKDCLEVDHDHSPIDIYEQYVKWIDQYLHEDIILVGHSLGGYWARIFAKTYNLKALLINPCLYPEILFNKIQYSAIRNEVIQCSCPLMYLIELGDEVLQFKKFNIDQMQKEGEVISWEDGNHKFTRTHLINSCHLSTAHSI